MDGGTTRGVFGNSRKPMQRGHREWEGILLGFKASPNHRFFFESFGVFFSLMKLFASKGG